MKIPLVDAVPIRFIFRLLVVSCAVFSLSGCTHCDNLTPHGTTLTEFSKLDIRFENAEQGERRSIVATDVTFDQLVDFIQQQNPPAAVKAVRITGCVGNSDVDRLKELSDLEVLRLDGTDVGDDALPTLWTLPRVRELTLAKTAITAEGVATSLATLRGNRDNMHAVGPYIAIAPLQKLRMSETAITSESLQNLAVFTGLVDLDVSQTTLNDSAATWLAMIPTLKRLNLYQTQMTDDGVETLTKLRELEWFNLDACPITDVGVAKLVSFPKLSWIHLGRTSLTDEGLKSLAGCVALKNVTVTRTNVTAEGVAVFRTMSPNVTVVAQVPDSPNTFLGQENP